jgi:hypothetical protein
MFMIQAIENFGLPSPPIVLFEEQNKSLIEFPNWLLKERHLPML